MYQMGGYDAMAKQVLSTPARIPESRGEYPKFENIVVLKYTCMQSQSVNHLAVITRQFTHQHVDSQELLSPQNEK